MLTIAWVCLAAATVACIDQASKAMLLRRLGVDRSVGIGSAVRLRCVANAVPLVGACTPAGLLLLWGVAIASGVLALEVGGSFGDGIASVGVAIALGGATGNLLDRLIRGHIVDFVQVGFWPVFNIADAAIVTGIGLILIAPLV